MKLYPAALLLMTLLTHQAAAQKWWYLGPSRPGSSYGVNMEEARSLLAGRQGAPVIVAVIDVGTDIKHKALAPLVWTNAAEVAGNGIDDDNNGYADDIHGWNFIGGHDLDIQYEASEETRHYQRVKRLSAARPGDAALADSVRRLEAAWINAQKGRMADYKSMKFAYDLTRKLHWRLLFRLLGGRGIIEQIESGVEMGWNDIVFNELYADSVRRSVVGDDPFNPGERYYGNNRVTGPDASHGTHVAGIVAAVFHNGLKNVRSDSPLRLMTLRAVPWGDERDKDIANAIRYAVDNGASVINLSFGKNLSPEQEVVNQAIAYALSKDVVLVHAAGNEALDIDIAKSYPLYTGPGWITVGASARKGNKKLPASFSNYGRQTVDLFAPGNNIYATMPGNKYTYQSGTSMAAPVVAGIAALIRSYFPQLSAAQIEDALKSTVAVYNEPVRVPGTKIRKSFNALSAAGGVVNAGEAVKYLLDMERKAPPPVK